MGFYLRKSIRVGALRFNLSGSGIGVSCGIPGFRIGTGPRGNYIHAGRGGIYYRKTFPVGKAGPSGMVEPTQQPAYQPAALDSTLGQLETVDAGTSAAMQDSSSQSLLDELNDKHRRLWLWPSILFLGITAVGTAIYLGLPELTIGVLACAAAAAVIFTAYRDTLKKTTVLLYDFDDDVLGAFANLDSAFNQASGSQRIWHVKTKAAVLDRKYHAGASSVIDAEKTRLSKSAPPGVKINILPMVTPLGGKTLYFLPDRVLLLDAVGFGAISYQDLRAEVEKSTFITGDVTAPSDASVVDYTWRYVNKGRGGGPDHRFRDNPQLPVIQTGDLTFSTDSGFCGKLKFSNVDAAEALLNGIQDFTSAAFRAIPKEEPSRPSAQPPPLAAVPAPAKSNGRPVQSHVRSVVIAVILLGAMAAGMLVAYQLRKPNAGMRTHLDSVSAKSSQSRNSVVIPKQRPAATKDVAGLVPVATSTAMPNISRTAAESSHSAPALGKSFPGGRFVTLVSPVSVQTPSRKTITLNTGSHFALLAVENDQAVIRYYDGRKYSIPLSATDYR